MMSKSLSILLFGANGQVGFELQRTLAVLGRVTALDFPDVDFAQPDSLRPLIRQIAPTCIINAAAYTAVDRAEDEPERAFAVNAIGPGVLAEEADALDAFLVHYSTDYVFDGHKSSPYVEEDPTSPLSVYGQSKLEGERLVTTCRKHLIFRTSWVVGAHGYNFIRTMLQLAGERTELRVVNDQHGAPTAASFLAEATADAIRRLQVSEQRWGLYHLASAGETTWHGLACHVLKQAQTMGMMLKARDVVPIRTVDFPMRAARPANSRLETRKFSTTFGMAMPYWTKGVDDAISRIIAGEL